VRWFETDVSGNGPTFQSQDIQKRNATSKARYFIAIGMPEKAYDLAPHDYVSHIFKQPITDYEQIIPVFLLAFTIYLQFSFHVT
jgi:hypothetical protein